MLTPKDIERKVFSSGIKGYKKSEVDDFLDEIMLDMESLINENERRKIMLADMKKELTESKEKASAMLKTLERARLLMSDISESAEKRAEIIIKNANEEAGKLVDEAKEAANSLSSEHDELKSRIARFKSKYKSMLTEELNKLENETEDWFSDLREDFYPASMVGVPEAEDPSMLKPVDPAVEAGLFSEPEKSESAQAKAPDERDAVNSSKFTDAEISTDLENTLDGLHSNDEKSNGKKEQNEQRPTLTDIVLPKSESKSGVDDMATTVVITQEEMEQIPGVSSESEKK